MVALLFFYKGGVGMLQINKKISNYNFGYNNRKEYIILHYTGNRGDTAKDNVDYFYGGNRGASAHYFVNIGDFM